MTNNQSNRNKGGRQNTYVNHGTPSPTLESTKVTVSVNDIKNAMFTYDEKMHNVFIVSLEKFLQFVGSKFRPSEQLLSEARCVAVQGTREPKDIETQSQFDAFTFKQKETWKIQLKSWNIKNEKVMDNLNRLYPYLWNQCTLPLKSHLKSHSKYAATKKVKDTVISWMLIEETCTSTCTINLVKQRVMKADLNLKSVYGETNKLLKYFDVFVAQAKVVWEAGVDFGSKIVVNLIHGKLFEKDSSVSEAPVYCNPLIKFKPGMKLEESWKVVHYNTVY